MTLITVRKLRPLTKSEIRTLRAQVNTFFDLNPRRRVCRVSFASTVVSVRRGHVTDDIHAENDRRRMLGVDVSTRRFGPKHP